MKPLTNKIKFLLVGIICFGLGFSGSKVWKLFRPGIQIEKEKLETVMDVLKNDWYYSNSTKDLDSLLIENAIDGMTQLEQDPHTNYFNLEQATKFASELEGSNVGLGFSYCKDEEGNLFIREVFMNSGVYQAGLKAGDVIVSIQDKQMKDCTSKQVVSFIQSNEGKELEISIKRGDEEKKVTAIPSVYDTSVALQLFDDHAYISVNSFSQQTGKEFSDAMQEVKKEGIKKVVLDLRGNAGGYLYATLEVASSLLEKGSVVFLEEDKEKNIIEKKADSSYEMVELDSLVVLQNGTTASASEALIGGLKYHLKDKVVTVGTTTYGKGTEQTQVPFRDGTALKYTVARWLSPDKKSVNEKGWKPDVKIETESVCSTSYADFKEGEVIKKDSVHENGEALQVYLQYLGYEVDRTDSYFSLESSKALSKFQSDHDLATSGDCNEKCWEVLSDSVLQKLSKEGLSGDIQYQEALKQL